MFLKNWLLQIRNRWLQNRSPRMVFPYRGVHGKIVEGTRVSNSTFIDHPEKLILGKKVYIGHFNFLEASHGMEIGDGCQVTNFVSITTHSSHRSIRLYGKDYGGAEMKGYVTGKVVIGKFTFIGPHSTIMPGSNIGKGSLVSAYSMVKGDFPDFSILAGNPATVIGDTRSKDSELIRQHPELKRYYDEWADS
jgi:acetyltransferase-like isoleucine patch superfamily enzyme